jgi:hypothetical protein
MHAPVRSFERVITRGGEISTPASDLLKARAYVAVPLIGKTQIWRRD